MSVAAEIASSAASFNIVSV